MGRKRYDDVFNNQLDPEPPKPGQFSTSMGLKPPRLMSCPHCAVALYSETTDDCGRVEGYCTWCSFEKRRAPIRASLPTPPPSGPSTSE